MSYKMRGLGPDPAADIPQSERRKIMKAQQWERGKPTTPEIPLADQSPPKPTTYHQIQQGNQGNELSGRFTIKSYPPAAGPWADPVIDAMDGKPWHCDYCMEVHHGPCPKISLANTPIEQIEAAVAKVGNSVPKVLAEMTDKQLEFVAAKAELDQKQGMGDVDELQGIKDNAMGELDRRRSQDK